MRLVSGNVCGQIPCSSVAFWGSLNDTDVVTLVKPLSRIFIIILVMNLMQGIYRYIPETDCF
jgi:hypothetical protein